MANKERIVTSCKDCPCGKLSNFETEAYCDFDNTILYQYINDGELEQEYMPIAELMKTCPMRGLVIRLQDKPAYVEDVDHRLGSDND